MVQLESARDDLQQVHRHLMTLDKHQMNVDLNDMTSHREPKKAGQSNKLAQPTKTIRLWQTPMPKILRMSTNSIPLLAGWLFGCRRLSYRPWFVQQPCFLRSEFDRQSTGCSTTPAHPGSRPCPSQEKPYGHPFSSAPAPIPDQHKSRGSPAA